jgi:polar amino acid transport system substrate-binding protein
LNKLFAALIFTLPCLASPKTPIRIAYPIGTTNVIVVQQLMKLFATALDDAGYTTEYVEIPAKRSLELASKGEIDGVLNDDHFIKEGRDRLISTSFPIVNGRVKIFYLKENKKFDLDHLSQMNGAISLNNGAIEDLARKKNLKYVTTKSVDQNLHLLTSGRVDYVIGYEQVWRNITESAGLQGKISMSAEPLGIIPIYFTMSRRHAENFPQIEKAIKRRIKSDGGKYSELKSALNFKADSK